MGCISWLFKSKDHMEKHSSNTSSDFSSPYVDFRKNQGITLTGDVMFVNRLRFVIKKSRDILSTTPELITNGKADTLLSYLKAAKKPYMHRSFKVTNILTDGQSKPPHGNLSDLHIHLNMCGSNSHVREIERMIRVIKERIRETYNTLVFRKIPCRLIVELFSFVVFWLNSLSDSVADELSARTVMNGLTISYKKHC